MQKVSDLFDVTYGNSLELNRLIIDKTNGVNFVSRTAKNNGVSAKVKSITNVEPSPAGLITVAASGSVMETFLQPEPFYTAFHVILLRPKINLTDQEKLFYCACLRANKYRYNYGRQANRTLKDILLPSASEIPNWVKSSNVNMYDGANEPVSKSAPPNLDSAQWKTFTYEQLFTIERGPRIKDLNGQGDTPFITSIDGNNGLNNVTTMEPCHQGNVIGVNRNGSVAEAFYQPVPFCSTEDVHIFIPTFELNPYRAMFLCTLIPPSYSKTV